MSEDVDKLLKSVEFELVKAKKIYLEAKNSAEEIAASAAASPSQSGDRFHSQGAADIAKQKLDRILALKKEIETKRESICRELGGKKIFLVENPIVIGGFTLVSTNSPIGKKMQNGTIE